MKSHESSDELAITFSTTRCPFAFDREKMPRDPHDWYVEPADCVQLLFDPYTFDGPIYDPCAGSGTIVKVARANGYAAIGTDLVDRGYGETTVCTLDFLSPMGNSFMEVTASSVVMNPPFGKGHMARAFVRKALASPVGVVAALLPAPMMFGRKTWAMYVETNVTALHPLIPRPSMPPGTLLAAGLVEAKGGKEDFFWAVWDRRASRQADAAWPPEISPLVGPERRRKAKQTSAGAA